MNEQCAKHQFEAGRGRLPDLRVGLLRRVPRVRVRPEQAAVLPVVRAGRVGRPLRRRQPAAAHEAGDQGPPQGSGTRPGPSGQRSAPQVEISAFDDFVDAPVRRPATAEENPLSWLDEHLGGSGERVPF